MLISVPSDPRLVKLTILSMSARLEASAEVDVFKGGIAGGST
jgi:hypothetical protein